MKVVSAKRPIGTGRRRAIKRVHAPKKILAKLVPIGNSRGVRLPKTVIEQAGLTDNIEISVEKGQIVLRAAEKKEPRADWEQRFKAAIAKHGPPEPMDPDWEYMPNEFDEKEWTW